LLSRIRPTENRAALGLRLAGHVLHKSQTFLGDYFHRVKARLGPAKAITAVAHKLAPIAYRLLANQLEYDATIFQDQERRAQDRKRNRVLAQARELGLHLVTVETVPCGEPVSASPALAD
jgi:transposase